MPTYEYECSKCGKTFEHFQSMKSEVLTDCLDKSCGGKGTLKRLIGSGGGIIFKGSGFYITDYKNGHSSTSKSPAKKDSDSAPPCASCSENKSCPNKES